MLTSRLGSLVTSKIGSAVGSSADDEGGTSNPMAGVTKDATSGIYCPATLAEWNTTLAAAGITTGAPTSLWLCQEVSGNIADSIGSNTGTASGAGLVYAQTISGWSRKGIKHNGGQGAVFNVTGVFNPSTTHALAIGYVAQTLTAQATQRTICQFGNVFASRAGLEMSATNPDHYIAFGSGVSSTGTANITTTVYPLAMRSFRGGAPNNTVTVFTDSEKLAVTPGALTNSTTNCFAIGGDNGVTWYPGGQESMYWVLFVGTAATITDAQLKILYQTLGWAPTWT